jgi:hypothetical protein
VARTAGRCLGRRVQSGRPIHPVPGHTEQELHYRSALAMSFGLSKHRRQTLVVRAISNGAVSQIDVSHFCPIIDHRASDGIVPHHPHGRLCALAGEYLLVVGNSVNIGTMLVAGDPYTFSDAWGG